MNILLMDFQKSCMDNVIYKIHKGAKHISVVMAAGSGKKTISLFIAQKLHFEEKAKTALVLGDKAAVMKAKSYVEQMGIASVDCYGVNEFIGNNSGYRYVMLHDLSTYQRTQIQECIKGTSIITISFFALVPEQISENVNQNISKQVPPYIDRKFTVTCVYESNEVIDIRDAKYAGKEERLFITKKNKKDVEKLNEDRIKAINKRNYFKKRNNRLRAYIKALRTTSDDNQKIKEQAVEIERLKSLLQEDERDEKIEALEARVVKYQKDLNAKDAQIAQQDQMIAFQQDILAGFGIDAKIIKDSFKKIQSVRTEIQNDLESSDESVKDLALKQLQDKVAEIVSELTQSALSSKDQKYFEDYLICKLTKDVWERLDDKSKTFLITAKTNFETMIEMKDSATFDYSGVCLLVTKALEVETTKRFFFCYKEYLARKYSYISEWPPVLKQRNQRDMTERVIDDSKFTLGSVVSVIGRKRSYDADGNIIAYPAGNRQSKDEFFDYAKNVLFKFSDRRRVEAEIEKDYNFIEKVRLDYRNPSAHRDRLTITSAKGCLEYVIDVQHMLREMLSTMNI